MASALNRMSDSINIGVSDIFWYAKESSIPVHLGLTKDGVTLKYETDWHTLTSDQTGKTPLDDVLIGEQVTAEVKVLDTSKNKIAMIMPPASAVGSDEKPSAVTFGQRPGLRASHYAGKLVIHPISMGNDNSNDVIIYRTANTGSLELAFKLEDEWVIPCVFKGYYDDFRKPGDQLFRIGHDGVDDDSVYKRVILFWITPQNPRVNVGETIAFRSNAMYEDGTTEDVTAKCVWVSSDPAKVSLSGTTVRTATANQTGSVVIRAELPELGTISSSTTVIVE